MSIQTKLYASSEVELVETTVSSVYILSLPRLYASSEVELVETWQKFLDNILSTSLRFFGS